MRLPDARTIGAAKNFGARVLVTGLIWAVVLLAVQLGAFRPIDDALRDFRFGFEQRAVTGSVVFVDIDARSLSEVGVWPWPRHIHADLLDRLMADGANETIFDVDFSAASTEAEDSRFEQSLRGAGGYGMLAAFRQHDTDAGVESVTRPLPRFAAWTEPVGVNVTLDRAGLVRSYAYDIDFGGSVVPTLAAKLANASAMPGAKFTIDYSINPGGIDRIPAWKLLEGSVDPRRLAGKQVVIGASALELRDFFVVPKFGVVPGAILQIMATESLKQGRALGAPNGVPTALLILLMGVVAVLIADRMRLYQAVSGAVIFVVVVEVIALLLQSRAGFLIDTAPVHLAQLAFLMQALVLEVQSRGLLHARASRERDATQGILDQVIADNHDGVVVVGEGGTIVVASRLAEEVLGLGLTGQMAAKVLPRQIAVAVARVLADPGLPSARPEELLIGAGGQSRILEYSVTRSEVPSAKRGKQQTSPVVCLTFRDITERRQTEEKLRFLVSHDPLTGALSRLKLVEMIDQLLSSESGRKVGVNIMLIDLRRFKTVNDTLGHSYGDMVLRQVVGRMKSGGATAVARLGGDSFAVLVGGDRNPIAPQVYCDDLLRRLEATYQLPEGHQAIISASAGATSSAISGFDSEVLLSHADMALSAAKDLPGGHSKLFAPEMDNRLKEKQEMDAALRQAMVRNQLSITFQPQASLDTNRIVGVEALMRWVHPELGAVSPARFIPAAEETGQIIEIGRWVLEEACREVASWPNDIRLAVNVSPIQLELTDFVRDVRAALQKSGLAPHRLDLEITEGIFVSHSAAVMAQLETLRRIGVGIALDDFGTGYSSLNYLGRLPVDKIKIDQGFVKRLPADQEAGAIIRAVMTLSETLDKIVVAEGIETADQAWMLKMMGCKIGQGYYFGRPMSAAELLGSLEDRSGRPSMQIG